MSQLTYHQLQKYLGCLRDHGKIDKGLRLNCKKDTLATVWQGLSREDKIFAERIVRQGVVSLTATTEEKGEIVRLPLNVEKQVIYKKELETGNRRIGIEFEFIIPYIEGDVLVELLRKAGVKMEDFSGYSDEVCKGYKLVFESSINDTETHTGLELVTPPIDLNSPSDLKMLKKALTTLKELGARVRKSCGTHVHIEASDLSREDIVNYFKVWQSLELKLDTSQPMSRQGNNNDFCRSLIGYDFSKCTNLKDVCEQMTNGSFSPYVGRYHKLNPYSFIKYGTLEVRHCAASLSFNKVIAYAKQQVKILESARV